MDLEGSDGRERGEDDTDCERQSALFALAVRRHLMTTIRTFLTHRTPGSTQFIEH